VTLLPGTEQSLSGQCIQLRRAELSDFESLLALRIRAMRDSLERLGRFDETRARERLADGFEPADTQHIVVDGKRVGFVVLKTLSQSLRLQHLYVDPPHQGRGIGSCVLQWAIAQSEQQQRPLELTALKGSAANRFYLRHGFLPVAEGEWDIEYVRRPNGPPAKAVVSPSEALG